VTLATGGKTTTKLVQIKIFSAVNASTAVPGIELTAAGGQIEAPTEIQLEITYSDARLPPSYTGANSWCVYPGFLDIRVTASELDDRVPRAVVT